MTKTKIVRLRESIEDKPIQTDLTRSMASLLEEIDAKLDRYWQDQAETYEKRQKEGCDDKSI